MWTGSRHNDRIVPISAPMRASSVGVIGEENHSTGG